jgi:hypothetical protein
MTFPNFTVLKYFYSKGRTKLQCVKLTATILHKEENFTPEEPGVEPSATIERFKALLYSVAVQESSDILNAVPKISRHT